MAASPLVAVDGVIEVGALEVDEVALDRVSASVERQTWWDERLAATRVLLDVAVKENR